MYSKRISYEEGIEIIKRQGIDPFFHKIQKKDGTQFDPNQFTSLYDIIFIMATQPGHDSLERLYSFCKECMVDYMSRYIIPVLSGSIGINTILEFNTAHTNSINVVRGLSNIFMYLDRYYTDRTISNSTRPLSINKLGLSVYKKYVFDRFASGVSSIILGKLSEMRDINTFDVNRDIQICILIFISIGCYSESVCNNQLEIYNQYIKTPYLNDVVKYYSSRVPAISRDVSCIDYLKRVKALINGEVSICEYYMHYDTVRELRNVISISMLSPVFHGFFKQQRTFEVYLDTGDTECLELIYTLYCGMESHARDLANMFMDHVMKDGYGARSTIEHILHIYSKYTNMISTCFGNSGLFNSAFTDAFKSVVNTDNGVTHALAEYAHGILRRNNHMDSEDTVYGILNNIASIYGYIRDKDIFESEYQYNLATRLLANDSCSNVLEYYIISLFKSKCGYQWSSKLEGMFKDIESSKNMRMDPLNVFNPVILTPVYWPSFSTVQFNIPKQLEPSIMQLMNRYTTIHTGRKMNIQITHGTAEVRIEFNRDTVKELVLTSIMMLIMLLYNECRSYTYKDILVKTGIPNVLLDPHLLSLANPKLKVLVKVPLKKELCDSDTFSINDNFKHQLYRITVPLLKIGSVTNTLVKPVDVMNDRRHTMDACIVRILKARRTMRFIDLQSEVIKQLSHRFMPDTKSIKERIEYLIDQDYIERNLQILNYIA